MTEDQIEEIVNSIPDQILCSKLAMTFEDLRPIKEKLRETLHLLTKCGKM